MSQYLQTNRQAKLLEREVTISCVVPMHNEAPNIVKFIRRLQIELEQLASAFEIIIIDDGSTDSSVEQVIPLIAENSTIKLLKLSRNFGKEAALSAGIDHVTGEVAILIDADFQHPIEMIKEFLSQWSIGYDMVYGVLNNRAHEPLLKRLITQAYYLAMSYITKINLTPNAGDFRLLDQKVVQALKQCSERNRFMKGLYAWVGFKSIGLPFEVAPRAAGASSWGLKHLAELAITGITSFSNLPLRLWSVVGFVIALCSFATGSWIMIKTLIFGIDVPGYASTMVAIFFFGGVQLCSIGVLGEYIARIFDEVKQRPRYLIESKLGYHRYYRQAETNVSNSNADAKVCS